MNASRKPRLETGPAGTGAFPPANARQVRRYGRLASLLEWPTLVGETALRLHLPVNGPELHRGRTAAYKRRDGGEGVRSFLHRIGPGSPKKTGEWHDIHYGVLTGIAEHVAAVP